MCIAEKQWTNPGNNHILCFHPQFLAENEIQCSWEVETKGKSFCSSFKLHIGTKSVHVWWCAFSKILKLNLWEVEVLLCSRMVFVALLCQELFTCPRKESRFRSMDNSNTIIYKCCHWLFLLFLFLWYPEAEIIKIANVERSSLTSCSNHNEITVKLLVIWMGLGLGHFHPQSTPSWVCTWFRYPVPFSGIWSYGCVEHFQFGDFNREWSL